VKVSLWYGHFTVVVEARNVDTSTRALKRFVTTFAVRNDELFEGVQDIYLDAGETLHLINRPTPASHQ
jgi:hypothetical protein